MYLVKGVMCWVQESQRKPLRVDQNISIAMSYSTTGKTYLPRIRLRLQQRTSYKALVHNVLGIIQQALQVVVVNRHHSMGIRGPQRKRMTKLTRSWEYKT